MLDTLCRLAPWRSRSVAITIRDLAEESGTGRGTVPKLLANLREHEMIAIRKPFGQNREGRVEITGWDRMMAEGSRQRVVGTPVSPDQSAGSSPTEGDQCLYLRVNGQGQRPSPKASRKKEYRTSYRETVDFCTQCGEQAEFDGHDGKPYCRSCRPASSLDQTLATPSVVVEDPEEEGVVALRDEPQSENLEFVAELDAEHLDALLEKLEVDDAPPASDELLDTWSERSKWDEVNSSGPLHANQGSNASSSRVGVP